MTFHIKNNALTQRFTKSPAAQTKGTIHLIPYNTVLHKQHQVKIVRRKTVFAVELDQKKRIKKIREGKTLYIIKLLVHASSAI